jgi:hypothetical protein
MLGHDTLDQRLVGRKTSIHVLTDQGQVQLGGTDGEDRISENNNLCSDQRGSVNKTIAPRNVEPLFLAWVEVVEEEI